MRGQDIKSILLVLCPPVWHKLPPLGLAYISEYLKYLGYAVSVLDLNIEDVSLLEIAGKYDCIGFSVFNTNQKNVLELSKQIKEKNPKIKILLGGPQCFSWQFEKPPDGIKYADNMILGDALPDLDERPFPSFAGFKLDKYERKRALPILFSRGCVRKCRFCSERLLSDKYSVRDPEKVIEEIRYNKKVNNTKWFTFHDSLINGDLKKLEQLCGHLKNEDIKWDAQAIIRKDMTEELLKQMKDSGCFNLFIGLESGSEKVLKLMDKGFTLPEAEMFFKRCRSVDLHFEVSLIVGFPGEGDVEFNETLSFIKRNREYIPKIAQINPFMKYSGTDVSDAPVDMGMGRVKRFIETVENLGIKYTPEFVNNLIRGQ
jgi:radical SAM superfamily enzyme YgiQ (UPF0313 family)